jgi:hypothetical protein
MNPITILFLLFFYCHVAFTQELDQANGFENYKFGTSAVIYKDLTLEIDEGNTKLYSLNTLPQINGAQLAYVRLTFCKNQLSAISIATKNSTAPKFLHYLIGNFGPANCAKKNSEWKSKKVYLIYEPSVNDAIISYYSNEVCKSISKKK